MTLKEKFDDIIGQCMPIDWENQCEKLADKYAVEVLEFYHNGLFMIPLKDGEAKEILNYIKKEKGL
jgi:hypothetical protein